VLVRKGIVYYYHGSLENAQDAFTDSLTLFQELENKPNLARAYNTIGAVYYAKGEFTQAIENYEQSLKMKKEIGNKQEIAITLNNLGAIFRDQGETEKAYTYLSKSIDLFTELGNDQYSVYNLMYLLLTSIDLDDIQKAEEYLSSIELIAHRNPNNKGIDHKYRLCRAIYLKTSSKDRNKGRAEEILSSIIKEEISDKEVVINAMVHLCDLLIDELRVTEDQSILKEIEQLTKQLLIFAKEQYSHSIIASTALLQAKLELLELNIEAAKRLLVQAELIAQEYGLKLLEQKISAEFDSLLNHEKDWIEAKGKPISFTELMDLAAIDDSIRIMVNKKKLQTPSFEIDEPVMLLIAKSTGISIYSKIFREFDLKSDFNEQLIGGFLSALNDFSD
jgi:tetratricopeptide (TPR) repeat protein